MVSCPTCQPAAMMTVGTFSLHLAMVQWAPTLKTPLTRKGQVVGGEGGGGEATKKMVAT